VTAGQSETVRAGHAGGSLPRLLPSRLCRLPFPQRWLAVPGIRRDIRVQFASTRQDWEEALQLVTDNYQARGFEEAGNNLRFTSFQALPKTVVAVAKEAGHVVATFTLVPDNTLLGLPLEGLYRSQIQQLRAQGRKLVETGSLAERGLGMRDFIQVFVTLMQLGWQHTVGQGADTTVIAVNPRHSSFYSKLHGFVTLGPRLNYDRVQGAPAEAFYLTPELMRQRAPQMHRRIFGQELPAAVLNAPAMPADLIRHFARRSSQTKPRTIELLLGQVQACGGSRR
jgi:hypothetical protein